MRKALLLATAVIVALIVIGPANAVILDNGNGGSWSREVVFPFTAATTTTAQFKVVINSTNITLETATGTPLANITDTLFWSYVSPTARDLRFSNTTNELYFWIENWNYTTRQATIWVNVTAGSDSLRMYYGNPAATESLYYNMTKTFPVASSFENSSEFTLGGVTYSTTETFIGNYSAYFAGSNTADEYIQSPPVTIKGVTVVNYYGYFLGAGQGWILAFGTAPFTSITSATQLVGPHISEGEAGTALPNSYEGYICYYSGAWVSTGYAIPTNKWVKITVVINATAGTFDMYVDGTKIVSGGGFINALPTTPVYAMVEYDTGVGTLPGKYVDGFYIAYMGSASVGTPYVETVGKLLSTAVIANVAYKSYDITGKLLINNSTTLLTPTFVYIPSTVSSTGYLATGSLTVPGLVNITIYLDSNYTLNQVVCNGTAVTPSYLGTYTSASGEVYNVYNFTSPSAGLLVVTANVTPVTETFSGCSIWLKDVEYLPLKAEYTVSNVNATYGADITVYIDSNITSTTAIYNGTAVTLNYLSETAANGHLYKVYNFTTYENGVLNLTMSIYNLAYNTTVYADGSSNFTYTLCGEPLLITTPVNATVMINTNKYSNVTSVGYTPMSPQTVMVSVLIYNSTTMKFGYHMIEVPVVWGEINLTIKNMDNKTVEFPIGVYNLKYLKTSTNPHTLYAGPNKLTIYYLGMPIKTYTFYLNHTDNNLPVTLYVNATSVSSPCYNMSFVSPDQFKIYNVHKVIPYGKFAVNHSGEVIIDFANNAPVTVTVSGNSYTYYAPYLYIYGAGNATVTAYYRIKLDAESALGIPMNITVYMNGMKVNVYGATSKIMPVDHYEIKFPDNPYGFLLKNSSLTNVATNLTTNIEIPTAVYKVPTHIELSAYKINTTSFKFPFFPFPLPFPLTKAESTGGYAACISGTLYNWYGSPVPNANITVKITSVKTGYTVTKTVNTSNTGTFTVDFNVSTGVNYTITAEYAGSPVYIGSKKEIMVAGGALPPAPQKTSNATVIIVATAITLIGAGLATAAYFMRKKRLAKAMVKLEKRSRFFKRVK